MSRGTKGLAERLIIYIYIITNIFYLIYIYKPWYSSTPVFGVFANDPKSAMSDPKSAILKVAKMVYQACFKVCKFFLVFCSI